MLASPAVAVARRVDCFVARIHRCALVKVGKVVAGEDGAGSIGVCTDPGVSICTSQTTRVGELTGQRWKRGYRRCSPTSRRGGSRSLRVPARLDQRFPLAIEAKTAPYRGSCNLHQQLRKPLAEDRLTQQKSPPSRSAPRLSQATKGETKDLFLQRKLLRDSHRHETRERRQSVARSSVAMPLRDCALTPVYMFAVTVSPSPEYAGIDLSNNIWKGFQKVFERREWRDSQGAAVSFASTAAMDEGSIIFAASSGNPATPRLIRSFMYAASARQVVRRGWREERENERKV